MLHEVDLAALRPSDVVEVMAEHPDCRPDSATGCNAHPHLHPAMCERHPTLGDQACRRECAAVVDVWIGASHGDREVATTVE
jgi:hypothetical protein